MGTNLHNKILKYPENCIISSDYQLYVKSLKKTCILDEFRYWVIINLYITNTPRNCSITHYNYLHSIRVYATNKTKTLVTAIKVFCSIHTLINVRSHRSDHKVSNATHISNALPTSTNLNLLDKIFCMQAFQNWYTSLYLAFLTPRRATPSFKHGQELQSFIS